MGNKFAQLYLENQLCFPLYAASRLTTKIYHPYLQDLGLTYPQYLVMLVLWQHETQTVSEIGNHLFLESNTLTPLLKRLERKELIQRLRSEEDERTVMISLTKAGQKLKAEAVSIPQRLMDSIQDDTITQSELSGFQKTLTKMLHILAGTH